MTDEKDTPTEALVFKIFWKQLCSTYNAHVRSRKQTMLLGTGNVYCTLTRAKYFQTEQRYPFDQKELKKDTRKLIKHIATECLKQLTKDLRAQYGIKAGAKMLVLIDPALVPAAWFTELVAPNPLAGCLQFNMRLTVCFPDELPLGPDGPKLGLAPAQTAFDLQAVEDAKIEKLGGTPIKRRKPGKLIT